MKIEKVINPGSGSSGGVFCKIKFADGRLSITGVVGPKPNGDCRGSCGQIVDHLADDVTTFSPGWNADLLASFANTWRNWHLNDMRAGCEHQRAELWGHDKVEVVTYGYTTAAHSAMNKAEEKAVEAARIGQTADLTETEKALISPDWFKDRFSPPDADSPLSGMLEVKKRETKYTGWVYENQHPRGVLCKPCPVCGYKYGSKWLREDVPEQVLAFLDSLPESTVKPAWV